MDKILSNSRIKMNLLIYIILICIMFIGIFFLEKFTPFSWDDYIHQFISTPRPEITKYTLHFIPFLDDYSEKFSHASRFIPHLMVTISRIISPNVFAFIVAFAFIIFCYLCGRVVTRRLELVIPLSLITAFFLYFLMPGFYIGFLWLSGICNYLFVGILILIFYLLLTSDNINNKKNVINYFLLFLYGFIAGWTNEGFVVGMALSTFIYYFFFHKDKLNISRLSLLGGFYLGSLYLCLSPCNLFRFFDSRGELSFAHLFYQSIGTFLSLTQIRILLILLGALILYYFIVKKNKNQDFLSFIKANLLIELCLIFSFIFTISTNFNNINSRIPFEFYALILLISLISKLNFKYLYFSSIICSFATIFGIFCLLPSARMNYRYHLDMADQIINDNDIIITKSFNPSNFEQRYIIPLHKQYGYNSFIKPHMISQYYGNLKNPTYIDESIYKKLSTYQYDWCNITEKDWESQWIKIPKNTYIDSVSLILRAPSLHEIPPYLRHMKDKLSRFTLRNIQAYSFDTVNVLDQKWLLVGKYPMKEIAKRQESLKVIYHSPGDTIRRIIQIDSFKE